MDVASNWEMETTSGRLPENQFWWNIHWRRKKGVWGFIIRDRYGQGVAAGTGKLAHIYNAMQAEAKGCTVLRRATKLEISHIILESDRLNLIKAFKSDDFDLAPASLLFKEGRYILKYFFSMLSFDYCKRSCNEWGCSGVDVGGSFPNFCKCSGLHANQHRMLLNQ